MKTFVITLLSLTVFASVRSAAQGDIVYKGGDPVGTVAYSLPSTTLSFEVEAVLENFYAGPYAKYAAKYLGIEVRTQDESSCRLTSVKMTPYAEADLSRRYLLNLEGMEAATAFLKLTASGLVSSAESVPSRTMDWRFPVLRQKDYSEKALTTNLTTEATTLYKSVKTGSTYGKVAMQQDMLVEKTEEQRAAEVARTILTLREQRMSIITGDTDATYSGEAMGAAVAEMTRLEQEYLTLFTGYSEFDTQKMTFDIIPDKDRGSQLYVAFRISDTAGLLPADNVSGRPVVFEVIPGEIAAPQQEKKMKKSKIPVVVYRIPATCSYKMTDGKTMILQGRVPVFQFGEETTLPVNLNLKENGKYLKYYQELNRF